MINDVHETLSKLSENNVSDSLKLTLYKRIQTHLELRGAIELSDQNILHVIEEDLDNKSEEIREIVWNIIPLCIVPIKSDLFKKLLSITDSEYVTEKAQEIAKNLLVASLNNYITNPDFNLEELLDSNLPASEKIVSIIIEAYKIFSKEAIAEFLVDHVFPLIFKTQNEILRNAALQIGLSLVKFCKLSDLNAEKSKKFQIAIENEYIASIKTVFSKLKHSNWYIMFILLLRFGGMAFHHRVDLTNAILKVVEDGFKSPSIENKLYSFECWIELIDNYSLKMTYMCSPKHIKLLVTPLKVNLSSNEVVVAKRFYVWVYLIQKLGEKCTLFLDKFLHFCFGPLGANPLLATENPTIASPGRKTLPLCKNSTLFLLELLGHYGHPSDDPCADCEEKLKLEKPVLTPSNFVSVYTPLIHSVGECCLMLLNCNDIKVKSKVVNCLWSSLLHLIKGLDVESRGKALEVVNKQLLALLKFAENNHNCFDYVLLPILEAVINFVSKETDGVLFMPLLTNSFQQLNTSSNGNTTKLQKLIEHAVFPKSSSHKGRLFKDLCDLMAVLDNVKLAYSLWTALSKFIPDLCRKGDVDELLYDYFFTFLSWPINNYNSISEEGKRNVSKIWKKSVEVMYKSSFASKNRETFQINIVQTFQMMIKKTPLLYNIITLFLPLIPLKTSKGEPLNLQFVSALLQLMLELLECPLTTKENINILSDLLATCTNSVLSQPKQATDEIFGKLLKVIEFFIQPHQKYDALKKLEKIIIENSISPNMVPQSMKTVLTDLTLNQDSNISQTAIKLLSILEGPSKNESEKSADNVLEKSKTSEPLKKTKKASKTSLIENASKEVISPFTVRGSQLNNFSKSPFVFNSPKTSVANDSPKTSTKKRERIPHLFLKKKQPVNDEDAQSYVVIESDYKFDKKKLTEHQKEVLKKRREDIPALYQDLSQSQSESQSNSQSNSIFDTKVQETTDTTTSPRVVVEKLDPLLYSCSSEPFKKELDFISQFGLSKEAIEKTKNETNDKKSQPKKTKTEEVINRRLTHELKKLKMDIVGGDLNIDLNESRKSRRRSDVKKTLENDFVSSPFIKRKTESSSKDKNKAEVAKKDKSSADSSQDNRETSMDALKSPNDLKDKNEGTRKRSNSLSSESDVHIISSETKRLKRTNRSQSVTDGDNVDNPTLNKFSEDIIESSQDSITSMKKPVSNTENDISKMLNAPLVEEMQPSSVTDSVLVTKQPNFEDGQLEVIKEFRETIPKSPPTNDDTKITEEVIQAEENDTKDDTKSTEEVIQAEENGNSDCVVISEDFSPDKLIRKDLDQIEKKPTAREIEICEADTESAPMDEFQTCPEITDESKTSENVITVSCNDDVCVVEKKEEVKKAEVPEKTIANEETPKLFDTEQDDVVKSKVPLPMMQTDDVKRVENSSRSARLIGLVNNAFSKNLSNNLSKKRVDSIDIGGSKLSALFSPKADRIRKMMQNCEDQKLTIINCDSDEELKEKYPENELLQFSREIPSPLATPKGSILKRKRDSIGDCLSDDLQLKRKRVNFSDPPTTCKKVFIQHQDELGNRFRTKIKNSLITIDPATKNDTSKPNDSNTQQHIINVDKQNGTVTDSFNHNGVIEEIIDLDSMDCDSIKVTNDSNENSTLTFSDPNGFKEKSQSVFINLVTLTASNDSKNKNIDNETEEEEEAKTAPSIEEKTKLLPLDTLEITDRKETLEQFDTDRSSENLGQNEDECATSANEGLKEDSRPVTPITLDTSNDDDVTVLDCVDSHREESPPPSLSPPPLPSSSSEIHELKLNLSDSGTPKSSGKKFSVLSNILLQSKSFSNCENADLTPIHINDKETESQKETNDQLSIEKVKNFISDIELTDENAAVLERLVGTVFDKMPLKMAWNCSIKYWTNRVITNED